MSGGRDDRSRESGDWLRLRGEPPVFGDEVGESGGDIAASGEIILYAGLLFAFLSSLPSYKRGVVFVYMSVKAGD